MADWVNDGNIGPRKRVKKERRGIEREGEKGRVREKDKWRDRCRGGERTRMKDRGRESEGEN